MFTGIVTDIGEVLSVTGTAEGVRRLCIASGYERSSIAIGASIACGGVCMTVVATHPGDRGAAFEVDAAAETLAVTTVGQWAVGRKSTSNVPFASAMSSAVTSSVAMSMGWPR